MGKVFTFSKLVKFGEHDEKYGSTYWGETNEQLIPVKFNSMNQDIKEADTIEAEEVIIKTSTKTGEEYHQLKKVKVVLPAKAQEAMNAQLADAEIQTVRIEPTQPQLDRIEAKLDKLIGDAGINPEIDLNALDITSAPDFLTPGDE